MGLDLVPTSAAAFAAAALVQTVRERRRNSRGSLGCFEMDGADDLDGVSGRGLSLRDRQRIGLRVSHGSARLPSPASAPWEGLLTLSSNSLAGERGGSEGGAVAGVVVPG